MYSPAEDTFLLIKGIEKFPGLGKVLEIGIGSGKVAEVLSWKAIMYIGCDIELNILGQILSKPFQRTELVCCDSATCFVNNYFDTIIFNPPYLPSEEVIDRTIDGGKEGNEIILKFLESSFKLIKPKGSIFFIISSLANVQKIKDFVYSNGFDFKEVIREHFIFEDICLFWCQNLS